MRIILIVLILLVVPGMAYIRLAPTTEDAWHQRSDPGPAGDYPGTGSFRAVRVVEDPEAALTRLNQIALATPRTTRFAGRVEDRMITYETRSQIMGFPDYTTIYIAQGEGETDLLVLHGRLRFGQADMGVNEARIRDWLDQLGLTDAGASS
ncbi:DUF1499 domain-containing protein [Aestuariibius insulae]|uniref:DUF1499 domain-containing protein n=1 Tax=Aestuariibius insulae TaxID=2058287 RepID=UPI00345E6EE9